MDCSYRSKLGRGRRKVVGCKPYRTVQKSEFRTQSFKTRFFEVMLVGPIGIAWGHHLWRGRRGVYIRTLYISLNFSQNNVPEAQNMKPCRNFSLLFPTETMHRGPRLLIPTDPVSIFGYTHSPFTGPTALAVPNFYQYNPLTTIRIKNAIILPYRKVENYPSTQPQTFEISSNSLRKPQKSTMIARSQPRTYPNEPFSVNPLAFH